jgi:hypothetical protein
LEKGCPYGQYLAGLLPYFRWTVNPYVNLAAIADQTVTEGGSVSIPVSATDVGGLSLTYTVDTLPAGLSISASAGLITGTPTVGDALAGPSAVTVTASDGTYSSSTSFNLLVLPATAPAAPTMSVIAQQSNQAGEEVFLPVQASDTAGYQLSYAATNLPDGLSIDASTGQITGTIVDDAVQAVPYQVTISASDGIGNTVSTTFGWMVTASPVTVHFPTLSPAEGVEAGTVTVANFTTPDRNTTADSFTAVVDYGDGPTVGGVVQPDVVGGVVSGSNGLFSVSSDHVE